MTIVQLLLVAAVSYLIGSMNFSIILSRYIAKKDIRANGSGNAGATNMYRTYGRLAGVLTMFFDIVKVLVAMQICRLIIGDDIYASYPYLIKYFSGFFCVTGHIFPLYFKFKGGKGVATCAGMILLLDWRIFLIEFVIFVIVVSISKIVSLGSLIMAVTYPFLTYFFYEAVISTVSTPIDVIAPYERYIVTFVACVFSLIIFIKHRENIKRIIHGNENKISFKKNKDASLTKKS